MQCSNCRRHLGWRFTRADSRPPHQLGEGAFDGNLRSVDAKATDLQQYWYWRTLLALAEEAGDDAGDVISPADWCDHRSNPRDGMWPPVEGYTAAYPTAKPHPDFARQATDQPLVFYGLTSDSCVGDRTEVSGHRLQVRLRDHVGGVGCSWVGGGSDITMQWGSNVTQPCEPTCLMSPSTQIDMTVAPWRT